MKILQVISIFFTTVFSAQTSEQLMQYAAHYDQPISTFVKFVGSQPSADETNAGLRRLVFDFDNHQIGLEEHPSGNGNIGELFIFQTRENFAKASYLWKSHFDVLNSDASLVFVKAMFEDGTIRKNNLDLTEFLNLMTSKVITSKTSYGVRYAKGNAYYSLFNTKGKLVFTVDDKNF